MAVYAAHVAASGKNGCGYHAGVIYQGGFVDCMDYHFKPFGEHLLQHRDYNTSLSLIKPCRETEIQDGKNE